MSISALSGFGPVEQLNLKTRKLTAAEAADLQAIIEQSSKLPTGKADNDPAFVYARVKVNGKTVATIYNSGATETSNSTGTKIRDLPSMGEGETATGANLAQKRAEEIAAALGGTVEKIATPQSIASWEKVVSERNSIAITQSGAKTRYDTQEIAQRLKDANDGVTNDFLELAKKTPIERIRDQILRSKNLTEEELAAMPPEKREAIEKEIADIIKEKIKKGSEQAMQNPQAALKVASGQAPLVATAEAGDKKDKNALANPDANATPGPNLALNQKKTQRDYLEEMLIKASAA